MRTYFGMLKKSLIYSKLFVTISFFAYIISAMPVFLSVCLVKLIWEVINEGLFCFISLILVYSVVLFLIYLLMNYLAMVLIPKYREMFIFECKKEIYGVAVTVDYIELNSNTFRDELGYFLDKTPAIYLELIDVISHFLSQVIIIIGLCITLGVIAPSIILIIVVCSCIQYLINKKIKLVELDYLDEAMELSKRDYVYTSLFRKTEANRDIRLYSEKERIINLIGENTKSLSCILNKQGLRTFKIYIKNMLITRMSDFCILLLLFISYKNNNLDIGTLAAGYIASNNLTNSLQVVTSLLADWDKTIRIIHRYEEFCKKTNVYKKRKTCIKKEIIVDDIEFNYPGSERKIIDCKRIIIKIGDIIGVIGPNGVGKTTLASILNGLYMSNCNCFADGIKCDIRDIKVLTVFRDGTIFPSSIQDNIIGNQTLDIERLNQAIDFAELREIVEREKDGINTLVSKEIDGEGIELSAGEKQKLLLARAYYYNPQILILDEALSSIDRETQNKIMCNIKKYLCDCAIILISHDEYLIKNADVVYILSKGEMIYEKQYETI